MNGANPNINLYNPTCEYAVANGNPNWQPNRILQKMEFDLSALPMFFAKQEDYVLVDRIPSVEFIATLKKIHIEIPNFILKKEALKNQDFVKLSKNELRPWGWSPAVHKFFTPIKESCAEEYKKSPVYNWGNEHREITSRKFAVEILKHLQETIKADYILNPNLTPIICHNQNEIGTAIKKWGKVMIKAPWSSSGRGLQPITKTPVHPKVWEKLLGIIKEQGFAIAEPYLNKVLDLAFLFEIKKGKVQFKGISYFYTNNKGQYEGNYLNGLPLNMENRIVEFTNFVVGEIRQPIINEIENSDLSKYYEGVFGIDMLIYNDEKGTLKINPCLEINVRHTMGMIALRLEKLIDKNKKGIYSTYFLPGTSFYHFKNEMEKKYPLKFVENKIESGFLALTEANRDSLFGAYLLI